MEKKITAAITAVGGYVPEDKLTNADLEKLVDTNDEWIKTRTGVEERRILKEKGKGTSDLAAPAVQEILRKKKHRCNRDRLYHLCHRYGGHAFPCYCKPHCR